MIELTAENFKSEIADFSGKALVDFWAPWCGPCRAQAPILSDLEKECGDSVKICKANTDSESELAATFGIMSIPTLILFENGKPAKKVVGLHPLSELKKLIGK